MYKGTTKPNYYVISKKIVQGKHIVTPYASKPQTNRNEIIVSGKKYNYKLNKQGYATTKTLPTQTLKSVKTKKQPSFRFW